jgi:hypothetical protein
MMTMENKMLSFQSFETNQAVLGLINKLIIYIKLENQNIDSKIGIEEYNASEEKLIRFLEKLNESLLENKSSANLVLGMDERNRTLVKNFLEAKSRSQKYKSILFKKSPLDVVQLLRNPTRENRQSLLDSLAELRSLIEEHISFDIKELIGDI